MFGASPLSPSPETAILSGSSLTFVGKRGIYTGMGEECEMLGFTKQGWLAA